MIAIAGGGVDAVNTVPGNEGQAMNTYIDEPQTRGLTNLQFESNW
jgi:hypothetical protein